jgi:hypothetical protein
MITANQIHAAAKSLNIPIEDHKCMIGLMLSEYVYYWWMILEDGTAIRHHIYSQRTGKSSKSWKRFFAAEDKINKMCAR